jgi:cell division protein FtsB
MLAGTVYFALFGGEYSLWDVRRLEKQRRDEVRQLEKARSDVKRLRARADSLERNPATLERVAREKYGMIRPGERLYRFAEKRDSAARDNAADSLQGLPDRNAPPR